MLILTKSYTAFGKKKLKIYLINLVSSVIKQRPEWTPQIKVGIKLLLEYMQICVET